MVLKIEFSKGSYRVDYIYHRNCPVAGVPERAP